MFAFFRSTGKTEFRRIEVPSNIGLTTSIPSLAPGGGSVITPNGSGRATPVANGGIPVVDEFPPDIQYYAVEFTSITSDPSLTPTKTAVLSPVIQGVPGAAIVPPPSFALSAPPPAATSSEYFLSLSLLLFILSSILSFFSLFHSYQVVILYHLFLSLSLFLLPSQLCMCVIELIYYMC